MIGGILGLYLYNLVENNVESGLDAYTKGDTFNFDGGMFGKVIKKSTGGKIDVNDFKIAFAKSQSKSVIKKAVAKGVLNYFFNPYVIAAKTAVGIAYDSQKAHRDEQINTEVFDLPTESSKYIIDERFNAISNNSTNNMEMVNYTVKQLLNSGNLAGSMIDRAFGNM